MLGERRWGRAASVFCLSLLLCSGGGEPLSADSIAIISTAAKRSWGPEQATGMPDTPEAGDQTTAWASQSPDDEQEWLVCHFERPVAVEAVWVHETYNPGALVKVTAFNSAGEEVLAWEGDDPTPRDQPKGISVIPVSLDFEVASIKLYIDSPAVAGWNEIDAVALQDSSGEKLWSSRVECSTTYAQGDVPVAPPVDPQQARIDELSRELEAVKERLKEMDALREEVQRLKALLEARAKE